MNINNINIFKFNLTIQLPEDGEIPKKTNNDTRKLFIYENIFSTCLFGIEI